MQRLLNIEEKLSKENDSKVGRKQVKQLMTEKEERRGIVLSSEIKLGNKFPR